MVKLSSQRGVRIVTATLLAGSTVALSAACVSRGVSAQQHALQGPVDHHMHPRRQPPPDQADPGCADLDSPCALPPEFDETGLLVELDQAGLGGAVVLSRAFAATLRAPTDTTPVDPAAIAASIRETNSWVARAVARHPDRLVGFLGVDPLDASAVPEIEHWSKVGGFVGVKMQLAAARFDFGDPEHVAALREVFSVSRAGELAILIHLRPSEDFGAPEVEKFIKEVLPAAEGVPIQVAHLAGWGSGYDSPTRAALEAFGRHIAADDPRTRLVQFDLSAGVQPVTTEDEGRALVSTMREIGLDRFLFGSDFPGFEPEDMWRVLQRHLPLTAAEFEALLNNRAWYLR